jgi:hypothetical protein
LPPVDQPTTRREQVIALHHWGSPWRQKVDEQGRPIPTSVNEGIRASAIVQYLRDQAFLEPLRFGVVSLDCGRTVRPLLRESSGRVSSLLAYYALGPPADYLIVGWLQRRCVYSLTAATGDGKTAIALLILEAR